MTRERRERATATGGAGKAAGLLGGGGADGYIGFCPVALGRREPSLQAREALVQALLHLVHVLTQPDDESERQDVEDERQNDETGEFFRHAVILSDAWRHLNPGGYGR